jgi:hypothetical protein
MTLNDPVKRPSEPPTAQTPRSTEDKLKLTVEIWKKVVDVQQHFNDLELRIRNYMVTLLVAVLAAGGFAMKDHLTVLIPWIGLRTSLACVILAAGLVGTLAFWFADALWYHKLLVGAVKHGIYIETYVAKELPELGLAGAIGNASPVRILWLTIHSKHKIHVFYLLIAGFILLAMLFSHLSVNAVSAETVAGSTTGPAASLRASQPAAILAAKQTTSSTPSTTTRE